MRSFVEDFEDQDEFEFESFAASRRLQRDKQHHSRPTGRKFHKRGHKARWENDTWDRAYDFDDYDELRFD